MNYRILLYRLTIAVAIGMLVAALYYRTDERSQPTVVPSVSVASQVTRNDQVERQGELNAKNQQQRLLAEHNAKLHQQQERLAPLQSRF